MERIGLVLLFMIVGIVVLIVGGVYGDRLVAFACRRGPKWIERADMLILWGLLVLAAFTLGLFVMYLLIEP